MTVPVGMPAPGDSTTAAALKVTSSPATASALSTERAVVVDAFCTETVLVPWMPSCVAVIAAGPPGETAHTFPEALTPARPSAEEDQVTAAVTS